MTCNIIYQSLFNTEYILDYHVLACGNIFVYNSQLILDQVIDSAILPHGIPLFCPTGSRKRTHESHLVVQDTLKEPIKIWYDYLRSCPLFSLAYLLMAVVKKTATTILSCKQYI